MDAGEILAPLDSNGPHDGDACIRLCILGPLRLWRGAVEISAGPRQQAYLLTVLLARAHEPITTTELVDVIWGEDPPASAVNVIQKYVGALRRLLEPELAPRAPGSYLHRRGGSYTFVAGPGTLDLADFRHAVDAAEAALAEQATHTALDHYVRALELWRGTAGDGFADGTNASSIFAALDDELHRACTAAASLALSVGQPTRVLPALQRAAATAPFHEALQASLISALGAAGRQAEALSLFSRTRTRLIDELGIDPGEVLQAAHRRVLTQRAPSAVVAGTDDQRAGPRGRPPELVGRAEELSTLQDTVAAAIAGSTAIGIVEGSPGVGKTRLLEAAAAQAAERDARIAWGSCLEGDGTSSMWPWMQVLKVVLQMLPGPLREKASAGPVGALVEGRDPGLAGPAVPDANAQFRLFEDVVAVIGQASAERSLVVVVDDLQWADAASLRLLGHLAGRLPSGTAILGSLRDHAPAPSAELSRLLAAASRSPRHSRIRLGPLDLDGVTELIRRESGQEPGADLAASIHARTAGNPFFVRELSRFLDGAAFSSTSAPTRPGVPPTVRDVLRARMAGLDAPSRDLLQLSALIGREVDLRLLASASAEDVPTCLARLEPLYELGLVEPASGEALCFQFAHDLIRESVVESVPVHQSAWKHLRIAEAIDRTNTDGESAAERLAFHLRAAGPLADPDRTAAMLVRAGHRAAAKFAFEAAGRHLQAAAEIAQNAGLDETELSALTLLTIVFRKTGHSGSSSAIERAEQLARRLGREGDAAGFLFARTVLSYTSGASDRANLARQLHEQALMSSDPVIRAYGRQAWGLHQWGAGNIGDAFRCFSGDNSAVLGTPSSGARGPLLASMGTDWPEWQAVMTALHGDPDAARALLATCNGATGSNPFTVALWAYYATMIATFTGDAESALVAVDRWAKVDPDGSASGRDPYIRQAHLWARALTNDDPEGAAAEAERHLAATLLGAPKWGLAFQLALIAESWLAAGRTTEAGRALDQAAGIHDSAGQRFAEGLLLLLRARLLHAEGHALTVVRAAAEVALARSVEAEAHLFADRARQFLAELGSMPAASSPPA